MEPRLEDLLKALVATVGTDNSPRGGDVGVTSRELSREMGVAQSTASRQLTEAVELGHIECGMGWRYSKIARRWHQAPVYWPAGEDEEET